MKFSSCLYAHALTHILFLKTRLNTRQSPAVTTPAESSTIETILTGSSNDVVFLIGIPSGGIPSVEDNKHASTINGKMGHIYM